MARHTFSLRRTGLVYDKFMKELSINQKALHEITKQRDTALRRFPLLFTLLGTFGIVATFYGFERLIDKVSWLANNPVILLAVGIGTLVATGQLYKKLG